MHLRTFGFATLCLCAFVPLCLPKKMSEKIIIDTDIGIDDAMAVLFAFACPELEVVGITTVFGNGSVNDCTRNALYVIAQSGKSIPVAEGTTVPFVLPPEPPTSFVHGDNGLGNVKYYDDPNLQPLDISAAEFIIQQSYQYPGELTVVPMGRFTNLALALKLDPTLPDRIKRIVVMGGTIQAPGNVTPVAEANIIGDPHAADIIFTAGWEVTMLGLDVTSKWIVGSEDLQQLTATNPSVGNFITDICQFYMAYYSSIGVKNGFYVHDSSTILYLVRPDLFETIQAPVRVVTEGIAIGQTIAALPPHDTRPGAWQAMPKTHIPLKIDADEANRFYFERLATLSFNYNS